jgi:hypothetical protein
MSMRDAAALCCALGLSGAAFGQALTGSGANLPIPSPNPAATNGAGVSLTTVGGGFTGSWSAPVLPDWVGTFSATGPIPSGNGTPAGITNYDFTSLPSSVLPAGTFFFFGDVDGGSTQNETFVLRAFDSGGSLITTPWLDTPFRVSGSGTGPGASIVPGNTPGWNWDAGTGTYTIDGSTVTGGNPSLGVWLESNASMATLELERTSNFANFTLWAPVPSPGTAVAFGAIGLAALRRRR